MLLASAGAQAMAAPTPTYSVTLSVDSSCTFTTTTSVKNAKIDTIYVVWYEAGFVNPSYPTIPDYIATSGWPATGPNAGVAKGKVVTFTLGPVGTDTVSHEWRVLVSFYAPSGALVAQPDATLSTTCYLPSPA